MADSSIDLLDDRLKTLEDRIYGKANKDASYSKIGDSLMKLSKDLKNATNGRDKIKKVLNQNELLEKYLDLGYGEEAGVTQKAKLDVILAEETQIRRLAGDFEKIQKSSDNFDSEHIKAVPSMAGRLQQLCKVQLEQQEQLANLSTQTRDLLTHYNNTIELLSKQFITWDEIVTQAEIEAQPKKPLD